MDKHLVIIDADSIIYQIAFVETNIKKCIKNFDDKITAIIEDTQASAAVVFVKGKDNFRYQVDIAYKGNRKDTIDPDVKERIDLLYEYAKDIATEGTYGEADDWCAITANTVGGDEFIVSHIDKDLDSIPGLHHNFRTNRAYRITPSEAYRFRMYQFLSGDATDNIQGLKGVGLKTAEKLLKDTNNEYLWDKVVEIWKKKQPDTWERNMWVCMNNIYIREYEEDLRPLTLDELKERLTWKITDIGQPSVIDQTEHLDSSTLSLGQQEDNTLEESN